MPSFEQANERVIDNAVTKFKERANKALMDGMYGLMNAALDYLHEAHELYKPDMAHESEANTLGWALVYNGKVMEVVAQDKGPLTPKGDALGRLEMVVSGVRSTGWVGIVLSDMANDWYNIDLEMQFLNYSIDEVKAHFHDFFKPVR